jgi:hypothetical protein
MWDGSGVDLLSAAERPSAQERVNELLSGNLTTRIGPLLPVAGPAAKATIPRTAGRTNGSQIWLCGPLQRLPGR